MHRTITVRPLRIAFAAIALVTVQAMRVSAQPISFSKSFLAGETSTDPTSLQFGPDGRLYVSQQNGLIKVYTVVRNGVSDYAVTATETITLIKDIPNHNDDGTLNTTETDRQVVGILVKGTASNPVLYVTSSDPRIAVGSDSGLDTNSSTITRLTWNGASWDQLDLVRGLARSEENHSVNGMQLDEVNNILYVCAGGNTNMGAPSNNFALLPEYALSAAILTVDLDAIGETTYDLPTLDDPSRPNTGPGGSDENDPFGGNDGANQAIIVPGGPVQVYSPGYRNAYDMVLTDDGRMYVVDNGPNSGWGSTPVNEGPGGTCTNAPSNGASPTYEDNLHFVTGPGYYGGHPNPTRANAANTFNGQSPIVAANPIECDYRQPGAEDGALATWSTSVNGLAEYAASNFGGAMFGDLLACGWSTKAIYRVELNAAGDAVTNSSTLFSNVGTNPLDVTVQPDGAYLAGTIWVCNHGSDEIVVYEPSDLGSCSGADDALLDEDFDGYTNADEIDNNTDPCSAGDTPPDFDGDFVSDLNDPDDDDDGIDDVDDAFAIDPFNGLTTAPPIDYGWATGEPGFGFLGVGFTGLMVNGADDYLTLFDSANMTAGGAAGKITIDNVPAGDAHGATNTQAYAFQFGVNVSAATGPFTVQAKLDAPFFNGVTPADFQSMGMFIGAGDQDNYVRISLAANSGAGGIEVVNEVGGAANSTMYAADFLSANSVELFLAVDPTAGEAQARVAIDGSPVTDLGTPFALSGATLNAVQGAPALAVGIIATSAGATPFAATWDFLRVTPDGIGASADISIDPPNNLIDGSTYGNGSFVITNTSTNGQMIERVVFDLTDSIISDLVFDPDGVAGDITAKQFQVNSAGGTGTITHSYLDSFHNGIDNNDGYDKLQVSFTDFDPGETMTFSIDNDPTSIKGTTPPGPNEAGSVSGLELSGAEITAEFDDGSLLVGHMFHTGVTLDASNATVKAGAPPAPQIEVLGVSPTPAQVAGANQTVRVTGPAGADVRVLVVEGGLFITGMTGPYPDGYDIDPFEANSAVTVSEYAGTVGAGGTVDIPITLTRLDPASDPDVGANDVTGLNHILAVFTDANGRTGTPSNRIIVQLVETAECINDTDCNDGDLCTVDTCDANTCAFPPVDCGSQVCNPVDGMCVDCLPSAQYTEDFNGYAANDNPADWFDTAANNSLSPNDSLFAVKQVGSDLAFGTDSTATNIHSHYVTADSATWSSYDFTGRLRISNAAGAIGITVLSDYPNTDSYYRLRRLGNVAPYSFHWSQHPDTQSTLTGDLETGVVPAAGQWLRFHVQVAVGESQTELRANLWPDGGNEPAGWQADAVDASASRLTAGTIGVWSFSSGSKYWDDLVVTGQGCPLIFDTDDDGDVDLDDWSYFAACMQGPTVVPSDLCRAFTDANGDGHVDLLDFALFQEAYTGAGPG